MDGMNYKSNILLHPHRLRCNPILGTTTLVIPKNEKAHKSAKLINFKKLRQKIRLNDKLNIDNKSPAITVETGRSAAKSP